MIDALEEKAEMNPTLSLSSAFLPEIADWKVGKKYTLVLTVKQVSRNEHEMKDENEVYGIFEIVKAKSQTDSKNYDTKSVEQALKMKS